MNVILMPKFLIELNNLQLVTYFLHLMLNYLQFKHQIFVIYEKTSPKK
jgi:hypothetical protein